MYENAWYMYFSLIIVTALEKYYYLIHVKLFRGKTYNHNLRLLSLVHQE